MMMNNSGGSGGDMAGSGGGMAGSGGGNEPTAAAVAADLQKQNALLDTESEITSVADDSTQIVNVATVQAADIVETSEVQSEIGPVDVSVSDGSMNIHPESQDASEPTCDEDAKQHIASEVLDVLDAPASEEKSDAVIVAEENVSEAAISNGLPCTNQQESERDEISGRVENLPSNALHEDAPSGNDATVNLTDDTKSQGLSEDHGVDANQKIQDDWSSNWVVLDAPASEERSDAVIVAEESVPEAAISNGLPYTNQHESERDEISGHVENLPSHVLHKDAPSGNDTTVNLTDDTKIQGLSEDQGVDTNQTIQDDWSSKSEEVTDVNEKHAPIEKVQENNSEGNLNIGGDVCINSAEEAKESSTGENNSKGNLNIGGDVCINSAEEVKESSTGENNSEGNLNIGGDVCINSAEEAKESSTGENNSEGNLNIGGDVCINSAEEAKESSTGVNNSEGNLNIGGDVCINSAEEAKESSTGENNSEGNLNSGGDVCINSAEEAKESSTGDLSGNVSHENVETLSPNTNGPLNLLDSKTPASELAESSSEGAAGDMGADATKSEAGQSVKECTEPHVVSTTTEDKEVNCGSEMNAMKTTPVNVCKDIPPEEVSEMQGSDIKERPVINSDVEVDSDTNSFDSRKSLLVNNDIVKVGKEEDSREEKNEISGATASVASESKTCTQDLESKVVTSTDTIHTGAKDGVDSQPAENKEGDAVDRTDDKVASICENGETQNHLPSASSIEGPALDASESHTVEAEIERRPFYFLPRVPRYDNEKLSEQLKHAEDQVVQKTQSRDALREDIQKIRATCKDYDISYKAAMAEERSARKAMHSKRQEIEALQSVITRVKSAASVDDIDSRVHNMEHIIQHETISLKEEKGYIREIKQLKQLREQISSSMGTKDEVKQALEEQEKTEERLKVLRKELDALRSDLSKAEAVTKAARKKCDEQWEVQSKLQEQFRAADAVRQEAFVHLQDLKKQQREKNKYFFKYRDDSRAASEMALKKDRAALQSLCSDQVENFMNMWNNDEEFRNYYVRCNTRSTYRRLGTLDGRSLGPDEEPPRITYATRTDKLRTSNDRVEKLETVPPVSAQQEKIVKYEGSKAETNGKAKAVAKPAEQKSQTTKPKKTIKPEQPASIPTELVSGKEEIEKSETKEEEEEPPKLTKEEEELIKKEEEKRQQKEAAKIKEQHRLEEIAKAKEAMERKKKREEKAKARAVLKAQKEAEEREKEREKKLRKKERRKGIFTSEETATENPIQTAETVIETPKEIEIPKKQTVEESQQIKKSSHKPSSQFLKQNKSKSVPLPLRNRGSKRKLRQWMWIGLIVAVILALFLLGNANLSFSPANLWFI